MKRPACLECRESSTGRCKRHRVDTSGVPASKDHAGWITYWLHELEVAIDNSALSPRVAEEHAVRSAHMLHWHAVKWKPKLLPPRDY